MTEGYGPRPAMDEGRRARAVEVPKIRNTCRTELLSFRYLSLDPARSKMPPTRRTPNYLWTRSNTVTSKGSLVTALIRITDGWGADLSSPKPRVVATFSVSVCACPKFLLVATFTCALVAFSICAQTSEDGCHGHLSLFSPQNATSSSPVGTDASGSR